jgi:hypothetical protein
VRGDSAAEAQRAERLLVLMTTADVLRALLEWAASSPWCPRCAAIAGCSHEGDCLMSEVEALLPRVDAVVDGTKAPASAGRA